ncbi:Clp protease N-terminal domain-containing protein [Streptosporangium sp. NPDC004631]
MFERFTDPARRVVVLAQEEARRLNHTYIGTEHLLLGLTGEEDGIAGRVLRTFGVGGEQARTDVEEIIGRGDKAPIGHIPFTPRAKKVLELSLREALNLHHTYIGTEHILLGLIREGQGVAAQVLVKRGARPEAVRAQVVTLLGRRGSDRFPAMDESYPTGATSLVRLDRIQESLDRIERRLDALGAPPDAAADPAHPDTAGSDTVNPGTADPDSRGPAAAPGG